MGLKAPVGLELSGSVWKLNSVDRPADSSLKGCVYTIAAEVGSGVETAGSKKRLRIFDACTSDIVEFQNSDHRGHRIDGNELSKQIAVFSIAAAQISRKSRTFEPLCRDFPGLLPGQGRALWVNLCLMQYAVMNSPIGPLTVATTDKGLASVHIGKSVPSGVAADESGKNEVVKQLSEYFAGKRTRFELPLDVDGTPFQKSVWNA